MRPFQTILLAAFGVIALLGLILFSNYKGSNTAQDSLLSSGISIWGTLPSYAFNDTLIEVMKVDERFRDVKYTQKDIRTFDYELLNALAEGASPDLLVISQADIVRLRSKLFPISFETIQQRTYQDTYIEGAEIFMRSDGIYGIPFAVDPMVMYWNRDLLSNAGLTQPPTTYEMLLRDYIPRLTVVDERYRISQSALALGEVANITNARDILAMLIIQAGGTIVDEKEGTYRVSLQESKVAGLNPANTAVKFYTQLSDPQSPYYSWNRSLPNDAEYFASNLLAFYFGFGSELNGVYNRNPNLNYDIAPVPQSAGQSIRRTYGNFYAFAIPRAAKNKEGSLFVAQTLSTTGIADALSMAPPSRSMLGQGTAKPQQQALYTSAITARSWTDPDPTSSRSIFGDMVENVNSGSKDISQSVIDASRRLEALFK